MLKRPNHSIAYFLVLALVLLVGAGAWTAMPSGLDVLSIFGGEQDEPAAADPASADAAPAPIAAAPQPGGAASVE